MDLLLPHGGQAIVYCGVDRLEMVVRLEWSHWRVARGGGDAEGAGGLARDTSDATHDAGGLDAQRRAGGQWIGDAMR